MARGLLAADFFFLFWVVPWFLRATWVARSPNLHNFQLPTFAPTRLLAITIKSAQHLQIDQVIPFPCEGATLRWLSIVVCHLGDLSSPLACSVHPDFRKRPKSPQPPLTAAERAPRFFGAGSRRPAGGSCRGRWRRRWGGAPGRCRARAAR